MSICHGGIETERIVVAQSVPHVICRNSALRKVSPHDEGERVQKVNQVCMYQYCLTLPASKDARSIPDRPTKVEASRQNRAE